MSYLDDLFSLDGRVAVVTGATQGIGRMIAHAYVRNGARVVVCSRKADMVAKTVDELSTDGDCWGVPADLGTEDGCRTFAEAVAAREAHVDILVNNAGATWGGPLDAHDAASWAKVLGVNLEGVFHTTRFLLPLLRARATADEPSRVINIGSVDGLSVPMWPNYSYAASKAGVHHLTRHLARDLAPEITVNCVAPGPFESKMMHATLEERHDDLMAASPLRRIGRPDDMGGIATFLASRGGSYLTGAVIPIDGGMQTCR